MASQAQPIAYRGSSQQQLDTKACSAKIRVKPRSLQNYFNMMLNKLKAKQVQRKGFSHIFALSGTGGDLSLTANHRLLSSR